MPIIERLEDYRDTKQPLVLTIGNFDGMHRGHSAVLKQAQIFNGQGGNNVVLTFRNHPSQILTPMAPTRLLCTLPHKLRLLEQFGIDDIILLTFTSYLAKHSAESFIEHIRQFIPFSHLVLGHDATLGYNRQGNQAKMKSLGMDWGFDVHYLEEYRYQGQSVSSTRIREFLQVGNLEQVEELLDRPYSIYAPVIEGKGKGKEMGFPTANLNVEGLCLPPLGVYAVEVLTGSQHLFGVANLGFAPTLKNEPSPLLEVHLFQNRQEWYGATFEVIFKSFIRPEKKFESLEELKAQIQQDIEKATQLLQSTKRENYL